MTDSFKAKSTLTVGSKSYGYYSLKALEPKYKLARIPYSHKILLENLLRWEDGVNTTKADVEALAGANLKQLSSRSEEHTSELQSLMRISYAVFCLKKKKVQKQQQNY